MSDRSVVVDPTFVLGAAQLQAARRVHEELQIVSTETTRLPPVGRVASFPVGPGPTAGARTCIRPDRAPAALFRRGNTTTACPRCPTGELSFPHLDQCRRCAAHPACMSPHDRSASSSLSRVLPRMSRRGGPAVALTAERFHDQSPRWCVTEPPAEADVLVSLYLLLPHHDFAGDAAVHAEDVAAEETA